MHGPRILVLLLIVCLMWAPVAPAFASAGMSAPAIDVAHAAVVHTADPASDHAQHHHAATGDMSGAGNAATAAGGRDACTEHDGCNGQCCGACAHCFNALTSLSVMSRRYVAPAPAELQVVYQSYISHILERPPQLFPV